MVGFEIDGCPSLNRDIRREWVLTNGIGGYAGGSVTGGLNRTHQGYLIASLHPPVERFIALSKTEERLIAHDCVTDLSASIHLKEGRELLSEGNVYLKSFLSDGAVTFCYEVGSLRVHKTIALRYGRNECAILYRLENPGEDARFIVTPLFNWREHSTPHTEESIAGSLPPECASYGDGWIIIKPEDERADEIRFLFSAGKIRERSEKYDINTVLKTETDNEADGLDCSFRPYDIVLDIASGESTVLACMCTIGTGDGADYFCGGSAGEIVSEAEEIINSARMRVSALTDLAWNNDASYQGQKHILRSAADITDKFLFEALVQAADNFISYRQSTGLSTILAGLPWFTDWGRDTMIAFTGLTLVTRRFDEAAAILKTFARYVKDGLVPNMFPDDGQEPLYNTADASLWYFYAVHKYLEYADGDAADIVRTEIWPCLKQIIEGYRKGTGFSIYMDADALIHAGGGFDQVTWMDVRVGDWVATPRHGKPVEINALWYNALKIAERLASEYGENDAEDYAKLAVRVKESFRKRFWYEEGGYLFDVTDADADSRPSEGPDDPRIRPNQIYAVSLPFSILDPEQELSVVNTVGRKLYAECGLRSLDPEDPDYHPIYLGNLEKRDHAYHQGTAWGFLLGAYITAYVKTHGRSDEAKREASSLIAPVKEHLFENCIGSVCEIFDGDPPHKGRGCYAQAWSVGEILRCLAEEVL